MIKRAWWKESVVYQIYPRSFMDSNGDGIGDLKGITEKLEYLHELGIDVIWLSPVYQSPNDDNGYDISDYRNIMTEFGTLEDFDEMLSRAHSLGIKIMMDLVVNHTSDEHQWFVESRKTRDNPYRDYYIWKEGRGGAEPNNWGSCFGGSAWQYDQASDMYYLHLFSKKQPDLNWENETVRREVYDMMTWWCDKGIDGFRMDVISMISKVQTYPDGETYGGLHGDFGPYCQNGPRVHEFLQEMNRNVLSKYDLITVGEAAGVTVEEAKRYAGGDAHELNMVFQFDHVNLGGGPLGKWTDKKVDLVELKKTLSKWQTDLEGEAWNSLYWDNHDQPRCVSRFGNDREYRTESAKMLATCIHMMQGTPYIYQGEELGMTNVDFKTIDEYRDIESINAYHELIEEGRADEEEMLRYLHAKSRDNARTPMQWDSSDNAGFTKGTPWIQVNPNYREINAAQQVNDPDSVFAYYKRLIELRKKYDVIVYGTYRLLLPEDDQLFVFTRTLESEKLLVICNFSEARPVYELPAEYDRADRTLLISNYKEAEEGRTISLNPYEARVYYVK